jgi:DNA replication protein DnaC
MTAKQRLAMARFAEAGIPKRYQESSIWNWQRAMPAQKRVWHWVQDYATHYQTAVESGRSAVFFGSTGTGKTHLAVGLAKHILEKGGTARYSPVGDMIGRIKESYAKGSEETEAAAVSHFTNCDLLVLDEVGRQLGSEYETMLFFRIVDCRYRELRPTVLVSNLNEAALRSFLGEAVVERIREGGGGFLAFTWDSYRDRRKKSDG